jgi:hypothetical protein
MIRSFILFLILIPALGLLAQPNETGKNNIPTKYSLSQNFPNPFNPSTKIEFELQNGANVKLIVFDLLGRSVKTLINEFVSSGSHEVTFDAGNLSGGVYFYKLTAGGYSEMKKMILLK